MSIVLNQIKIGTEEYFPKLTSKPLLEPKGDQFVINFSQHISIPYERMNTNCQEVIVKGGTTECRCYVETARLVAALRLPNASTFTELCAQSKLIETIRKVEALLEKEKGHVFKTEKERFVAVYPTHNDRIAHKIREKEIEAILKEAIDDFFPYETSPISQKFHLIDSTLFISLKEKKGLRLLRLGRRIGEGTYGIVFEVNSLFDKKIFAMKVAKRGPDAQKKMRQEFERCRELYGDAAPDAHYTGIQHNFLALVTGLPIQVDEERLEFAKENFTSALIGHFCNLGNLFDILQQPKGFFLRLNAGWKDQACYQLLIAAVSLSAQKKYHLDLCLKNVLVEFGEEGFLKVAFGDLEGIVTTQILAKDPDFSLHSNFITASDFDFIMKNHKKTDEVGELLPKVVGFSLATILFGIQSQSLLFPYHLEKRFGDFFADLTKGKQGRAWEAIDKKHIADFLEKSLFGRLTPEKMLGTFHYLMKKENPKLHALFDQQVKDAFKGVVKDLDDEKEQNKK